MLYRLYDLRQMLVSERLVYAYVVVSPAEMGCCTRLYTRTRTAGDGIHIDVIVQHQVACQRQKRQLDSGGKATGVSHILALADGATVQLGQSVYERVVLRFQAVIHGEVYHLKALGQGVGLHELAGVTVSCAEEEHIDSVKRQLVGKGHIGLTYQTLVNRAELVTGVAGTVYEHYLRIGMTQKNADELSCRITGTSYYSDFNHCSGITSAQMR